MPTPELIRKIVAVVLLAGAAYMAVRVPLLATGELRGFRQEPAFAAVLLAGVALVLWLYDRRR